MHAAAEETVRCPRANCDMQGWLKWKSCSRVANSENIERQATTTTTSELPSHYHGSSLEESFFLPACPCLKKFRILRTRLSTLNFCSCVVPNIYRDFRNQHVL